jgi:hypothetical protein
MFFRLQKVLGRKQSEPLRLGKRCLLQLYSKT